MLPAGLHHARLLHARLLRSGLLAGIPSAGIPRIGILGIGIRKARLAKTRISNRIVPGSGAPVLTSDRCGLLRTRRKRKRQQPNRSENRCEDGSAFTFAPWRH